MAEIDQLISFASRQGTGGFVAKIGDGAQVVDRFEELIHAFSGERENAVKGLAFGTDQGQQRRSGKVYAGDAAFFARDSPSRTAAIGEREFLFVGARFADEIGFKPFQAIILFSDIAMERDGFGDEFFLVERYS